MTVKLKKRKTTPAKKITTAVNGTMMIATVMYDTMMIATALCSTMT